MHAPATVGNRGKPLATHKQRQRQRQRHRHRHRRWPRNCGAQFSVCNFMQLWHITTLLHFPSPSLPTAHVQSYPLFAPVTCPETVCSCTQLINLKSLHLFIQHFTKTESQITTTTTTTNGDAKRERERESKGITHYRRRRNAVQFMNSNQL